MYFTHPQIKLNFKNLKKIFTSFCDKPGLSQIQIKRKMEFYFPGKELIFTDMGRTAFRLIVEKYNLQNSQMLMPAYICDVFYPILKKYNIRPIFLDIDLKTFNINPEEILQKITPEIKSILICHTYGLPNNMERIKRIINNRLLIIEDCSHSFGTRYQGRQVGNFGEVAFFSLYKQFPCLRGGMLVFNSRTSNFEHRTPLVETHFNFRDFLSFLNCFPFFSFLFKKFGSGIAPQMLRKEKIKELSGINRISLNLFSAFLKDFDQDLEKRIESAKLFQEKLKKLNFEVPASENPVFCYLSALTPKNISRDKLVRNLRKYKVFATRIWHTPIILNKDVQKEYNLNLDEFKNTVEAAQRIINFPLQNYYTEKDIEKIINTLSLILRERFS